MPRLETQREWPFCQEDVEVAAPVNPSFFPVLLTKAELFKWAYRVKQWKVDFVIAYTAPFSGGTQTVTVNYSGTIYVDSPAATEKEHACSVTWDETVDFTTVTGSWSDTAGGSGTNIQIKVELQILKQQDGLDYSLPDRYYYLRDPDAKFLPSLKLILTDTSSDSGWSGGIPLNNAFADFPGVTFNATFDGFTLPVYAAFDITTLSGTLEITPNEFWEYDPSDGGGPIYDSTDGSELRNPYSC